MGHNFLASLSPRSIAGAFNTQIEVEIGVSINEIRYTCAVIAALGESTAFPLVQIHGTVNTNVQN